MEELKQLMYNREIVSEFSKIVGEYSFRLEQLSNIEIRIRIKCNENNDGFFFQTSHFIKTPLQATAYRTSRDYGQTEQIAIQMALETITSFYNEAINEGLIPDESWLEENESY